VDGLDEANDFFLSLRLSPHAARPTPGAAVAVKRQMCSKSRRVDDSDQAFSLALLHS
jgi:hypothetical protein